MPVPNQDVQSIVNKAVTIFDCEAPGPLAAFLTEVLQWNQTLGLVSKREPFVACERLVLESLELARLLAVDRERVADIGSGAGFPGIVWALSFPNTEVTMIERREKRALFLERMCRTLSLENATSLALDARDASRRPESERAFDLVVTMAVGDPSALAATIEPMLRPKGRFVSTIAGAAPSADTLGSQLLLERRLDGEFGCYAVYHCGV